MVDQNSDARRPYDACCAATMARRPRFGDLSRSGVPQVALGPRTAGDTLNCPMDGHAAALTDQLPYIGIYLRMVRSLSIRHQVFFGAPSGTAQLDSGMEHQSVRAIPTVNPTTSNAR